MTKAYRGHEYILLSFFLGGNVILKMGIQQHSHRDRCVKEVA